MAYDEASRTVLMFGGRSNTADSNETWIWDGPAGTWTRQNPPVSPPPAGYSAMAYDAATGSVLMFRSSSAANDVWRWDGSARNWAPQPALSATPSARAIAQMGADKASRTLMMFGGRTLSGDVNETWTWNGSTRTWTRETPMSSSPAPRLAPAMAAHDATGQQVLFGGRLADFVLSDETWTWSSGKRKWVKRNPVSRPCARHYPGMAYHKATKSVVLFGGNGCEGVSMGDTWVWNGINWKRKAL